MSFLTVSHHKFIALPAVQVFRLLKYASGTEGCRRSADAACFDPVFLLKGTHHGLSGMP